MSGTGNDELVPVMVPKRDLPAVYALLGRLSGGAGQDADEVDEEEWAEEELTEIAVDKRPSFTRVSTVLDVLAPMAPKAMSYSELAKAAGLTGGQLLGALSGFARSMNATYGEGWSPFNVTWGESTVGAKQQGEAHYSMDTTTAERWLEVRKK
jgi:hypothetical protein